tara:strand:+ start:659 stop:1339 length:681 start_codon:yes stop_codon:yes gene_type:complete
MEKLANKRLFLFLVFIFLLIIVFIFKNKAVILKKNEHTGVFFKRPFPLIKLNPKNNLIDPTSFLIMVENETSTNSFFSKLETRFGSIEGKMVKVSGELLRGNGARFIKISNEPEAVGVLENQNIYPSEQTKMKKINLDGKIIDLKCTTKNDFSMECFYENLYKGVIPALRILRNKENIDYLLKIKDYKLIDNYLKNNFETIVRVFGGYYYQNGFNVISLDSISDVK